MNYPDGILTEQQKKCIPNVTFELIPISNLTSNQDYQRNLSEKQIGNMVEEFNVFEINPVKVSRRDGVNYIFDGQHTAECVAMASGSRDTPIWCMVYSELNYVSEAATFADQQRHTRRLSPYEIFAANIEAGAEKQKLIQKTAQSYGLVISGKKLNPNHVCAVSTLEKIYDKYGFSTLDSTLRLSVGTWQGQMNSLTGNMLLGVARLIHTYEDKLDEVEFRNQLGKQPVSYIIRLAKERGRGHLGYAEALIEVYNGSKKKNGLNPMGLHGGPLTFQPAVEKKKNNQAVASAASTTSTPETSNSTTSTPAGKERSEKRTEERTEKRTESVAELSTELSSELTADLMKEMAVAEST